MWLSVGYAFLIGLLASQVTGSPLFPIKPSVRVADNEEGIQIRLINDTIPVHYDVTLSTKIHIANFEYDGEVSIKIQCLQATSEITLHNRVSVIESIVVTKDDGGATIVVNNYETFTDSEFLKIGVAESLEAGKYYHLLIKFKGQHTTENYGWYRARYLDDNGEERWFATTDFEAPDARQAFPCYDEPDHKATFAFKITNHKSYHAISNMPITSKIENEDETTTTTFGTTPRMSTYLLAFIVSDFAARCKPDVRNREHCVYVRPNGYDESAWALDTSTLGLNSLERILRVDYTLPKMDQIAIPDSYFASGAMENWGLVTYRETRLLIDESNYNYREKDYIGTVILHEYAHQWFGDLVTPKWWTYLWLNEGFATLFEYYATDKVYPDMRLTELMVLESIQGIMESDGADAPRPMTHYVESNDAIRTLFNYVSYQKSGAVLRMMLLNLGESTFYQGLQYYLQKMVLQNAVAEDLFEGIQRAVTEAGTNTDGLTIKTIMDSWTLQGGVPIISVTKNAGSVSVTQKKFMVNNADPERSSFYIPLTYATKNDPDFESTVAQSWFHGNTAEINIPMTLGEEDWVIFNKQQSSYYRVNYDDKNWWLIVKELKEGDFTKIHLLNRAQLLDDALDLARYGRIDVTIAMGISEYLAHETDYVPWAAADTSLTHFYTRMIMTEFGPRFRDVMRGWVENLYEEYRIHGAEQAIYFRILARNLAYRWACNVGLSNCQKDMSAVMSRVINDGAELTKDYQDTIPCAGMRAISDTDFETYFAQFQETTLSATRNTMISRMTCSQTISQIENLLSNTKGTLFTAAEKLRIYNEVAVKSYAYLGQLVAFLETNSDILSDFTLSQMNTLFLNLSNAAYIEDLITRIRALATSVGSSIGSGILADMDTKFEENRQWIEDYGKPINTYFGGAATVIMSMFLLVIPFVVTVFNN